MIDTHAHLDALDDDPADVVARARDAGVTRILTVGTDVAGCRRALELADRHDEVYAILGIHPHEANDATDDDVAEVRVAARAPEGGRRRGRWASTGSATTRRATSSCACSRRCSTSRPTPASRP